MPFLTELHGRAEVKGSRDPLGLVPGWAQFGGAGGRGGLVRRGRAAAGGGGRRFRHPPLPPDGRERPRVEALARSVSARVVRRAARWAGRSTSRVGREDA